MNKFEQILANLELNLQSAKMDVNHIEIDNNPDLLDSIEITPGLFCGVSEIAGIFSWKRCFSYLWTGTPNSGKTTMSLFMALLMAVRYGWKSCVWTQEMEDSYLKNGKISYHVKDLVDTLIWAYTGITPYEHVANKYGTRVMTKEFRHEAYEFINNHFIFVHCNNRTPSGIAEAFLKVHEKKGIDMFFIDPWKSVKQEINIRSDIWLEDVLMSFREFSLETNSIMNYIVHPKSLVNYKDETGNYRVITPFDLNGGAAWFNSMDVIVSLRRFKEFDSFGNEIGSGTKSEWYTYKVRKQHLVGETGSFLDINFSKSKYRFEFGINDPLRKGWNEIEYKDED